MDMAELLPDRLGVNAGPVGTSENDDKQSPKTKRRQVTNILEWIQCYSIYMAVVVEKHPEKIQDLLGYQTLIVEARREYDSDTWLGYDRRFRQNAAVSPGTVWARIDPTLWNMAFTGQAKSRRCKYCFSLSHQSVECDWAPANPSTQPTNAPPPTNTRFNPRARADQVCYSWNHSPEPNCAFPGCKYQHVCLYCAKDLQATNKEHKAMYCNHRRNPQARQLAGPQQQTRPANVQLYHPY